MHRRRVFSFVSHAKGLARAAFGVHDGNERHAEEFASASAVHAELRLRSERLNETESVGVHQSDCEGTATVVWEL